MFSFSKFINKLFHRPRPRGQFVGRQKTRDINFGPNTALKYRMGAGFPGDVNRTHPADIEPVLLDGAIPPTFYGCAVLINAAGTGVRLVQAGDSALTAIYGFLVRPYPVSQVQATTNFAPAGIGSTQAPLPGAGDVLKSGYVMATVNGATVKGGAVFVWVAASAGPHVQGGLEAAATGGSTIALDAKSYFNGAPDANGVVEVAFNL